jgi:FAD/FMN-containing dehydrogenase
MKRIAVDAPARRVAVCGGAKWGDLDPATQAHGLAVTGGLVTHTGVGGLTLGGGIGNLMRRCGLTCDNLVAAELVTAAGDVLQIDEEVEGDLMWGLRGGGGNFGVVTRFEYRLHEVGPTVLAGVFIYPLAAAGDVLRFYRDWAPGLPDAMTTVVALRIAPPASFVPQDLQGRPVLTISFCWAAQVEDGERVLEPLRRAKPRAVEHVGPKPYVEHQSLFDASAPHGRQNYKRNANLAGLSDAAIDVLIEHARRSTSLLSLTLIFQLGGAVARVPEDATAYSDRGAMFNVDINAQWQDPSDPRADEHMQWVRDLHAAIRPLATGGAYVNFLMGDEGKDRVRATYGEAKHARLVQLKKRFDPDNVFRLNQNIDSEAS